MNKISAAALAVLLTATTGLAATGPALAQPGKPPMGYQSGGDDNCNWQRGDGYSRGGWHGQRNSGWDGQHGGRRGGGMGGGMDGPSDRNDGPGMRQNGRQLGNSMTGLFNFQRGAEAIELALVRISHRLNLTAEQRPLFEQMRTAVMDAVRKYVDDTAQVRAERSTPTAPLTIPDLLQRRIVLDNAQLEALTSVVPSVTAFYESLTPEQQALLTPPQRGQRGGGNWGGQGNNQPDQSDSQPPPDQPAQPPVDQPAAPPPTDQPGAAPAAPPSQPPAPPPSPAPAIRG
ncbi:MULTISPECIES: Spy/CpxP family protein refolding chaperone [unclassified Devosia]|uniref:Spy/CpxP family protein refolding chaperone n=1 Tax=unclassified Devosia TaxID=196773 RepID=UPI0015544725|nr:MULTISPECIES: Spy/CpxP family protein refolding chaperone [unclassified Devosia]